MRKRLEDIVKKSAAPKRTAVIWLEEIRGSGGGRREHCLTAAPSAGTICPEMLEGRTPPSCVLAYTCVHLLYIAVHLVYICVQMM